MTQRQRIQGADIRVGDVLHFNIYGDQVVTALRPYNGPLCDLFGAGSQTADLRPLGAFTLPAGSWFDVTRWFDPTPTQDLAEQPAQG